MTNGFVGHFYFVVGGVLCLYVFPHHDVRAEVHCQPDNKSHSYLAYYLVFPGQSVFIMLFQLFIIVEESEHAEKQRGDNHKYHIYICEIAYEQAWHYYGYDYDYTAHRWRAFFAHLPFKPEISHDFADLHHLQPVDYAPSYHGCYEY